MRPRPKLLLAIPIAVLALFAPAPARAQPVRLRMLDGVRIAPAGDAWDVIVALNLPAQVRLHSPASHGRAIQVQLALLGAPAETPPRESISVSRQAPVPLESVTWEGSGAPFPSLELRFSRDVDFELRQGRDLRSIVLRVRFGTAAPAQAPAAATNPNASPPTAPAEDARTAELLAEGRRALTAGEYARAALVLQAAVERPANAQTPEALELLGLARERQGQLAHAKAAYEEHLARFPDSEGAPRVRQRLETLVTARTERASTPRAVRSELRADSLALQSYGSLYVGYRHQTQVLDEFGRETFDSTLFSDLVSDTRLTTSRGVVRTYLVGGYRHQFAEDSGGEGARVSSAFVSFEPPERGISASLGRRTRSSGGILGRYDGAEVAWRGGEQWKVGLLAGMPVDSPHWSGLETDRFVGGVNAEFGTFFDALDFSLFAVGQTADSFVDRAAIGGELRYFRDGLFAALFIDYDAWFQSLNAAQLTGNWQITPSTLLTALFDHRNVPFLTTRNSLQGQSGGLDALHTLYSDDEIRSLAEDVTGRATTIDLGVSHRLRPDLQLAFDLTASNYWGNDGTDDIPAYEGTGFEYASLAQLIANDVLTAGDIGVASLRWFAGDSGDVVTFGLQGRAPLVASLLVNPRFFTIYQTTGGDDAMSLRPSLRFDYKLWKLAFDLEGGVEWTRAFGGALDPPWGYFLTGGVRFDF